MKQQRQTPSILEETFYLESLVTEFENDDKFTIEQDPNIFPLSLHTKCLLLGVRLKGVHMPIRLEPFFFNHNFSHYIRDPHFQYHFFNNKNYLREYIEE